MASGDSSALLLEKVSCPECKGTFENPKCLSCLHSVCIHCLKELQTKSSSRDIIVCPTCKQESKIEGGNVEKLPDSPYINSLCEVLRILKSKTSLMKCLYCDKEPTSLQGTYKYCSDCRGFFCDPQCFRAHKDSNKEHRVLPWSAVGDSQEGAENDLKDVLKPCPPCLKQHHKKKELELFCTECKAAICSLCSHTDHEKHAKVVLGTAADERKTQVEAVFKKQSQEAEKKVNEITQLGKECDEVDRQTEKVKKEVIDFFNCITKRLEAEKEKALAEVEDVATRSRDLLQRRKRLLQNQEEVIRITKDTSSILLKHSTSVDVIDLKNALDQIVSEVKEEERANCDPNREPLQMRFVKAQEICDILDTKGIGSLRTRRETNADNVAVDGKEISEATAGIEARFQLTTKTAGRICYNAIDRIEVNFRNELGDEDCVTGFRIQDNENGSYGIRYFAKECGDVKASVKVNGDHVRGSPFTVSIKSREFRPVVSFGRTSGENMERWGLAVSDDDKKIAVTQDKGNRVQLYKLKDTYTQVLSFDKVKGMGQPLKAPQGIVFDKKGRIFVADSTFCVVHIFSLIDDDIKYEGKFGSKGEHDHQFKGPLGLSIDQEGRILVADNKAVKIFTPEGKFLRKFGGSNNKEGSLDCPCHCVQCGKYLVVSDTFKHAIKVFDQEGKFLYPYGRKGGEEGHFLFPRCLTADKLGHLLVCDTGNRRVLKIELTDSYAQFKGTIGKKGSKEGEINKPFSVAVLSDGRIVVNDIGNKCIQVIK